MLKKVAGLMEATSMNPAIFSSETTSVWTEFDWLLPPHMQSCLVITSVRRKCLNRICSSKNVSQEWSPATFRHQYYFALDLRLKH